MSFLSFLRFSLSAGDTPSMTTVLNLAGELVTWIIKQMGFYLSFIMDNPFVATPYLIVLAGLGLGMLVRVWGSIR